MRNSDIFLSLFLITFGIRNALVSNFNQPEMREDRGALWENFVISERMKYLHYNEIWANSWFWRTKNQQEIDYIEEKDGKISAYELKWNATKKAAINPSFKDTYNVDKLEIITPENIEIFLLYNRNINFSGKKSAKVKKISNMNTILSYQNAITLLQNLIKIPSFSREETAAADFLQQEIENRGFAVNRKGNNLWVFAKAFNPQKKTLLLNSHIDTVRPVSAWSREPFKPDVEGDTLFGLGSNDAGASLVSLLETFCILAKTEQPYNLIFSISAEEEVSGANGCATMIPELPTIDLAVVGEPTGMQMAVTEKGLLVLDCTAQGKSGHAAREEGENAIYKAIKDIDWFRNYRFPLQSDLSGAVKMSVTMINAGTQHNVVPDKCAFVVDIRTNEFYKNTEVVDFVRKNVSCEVVPRSTHLNSSHIPLTHPIVQRGLALGLTCYGSPTSSDQMRIPYTSIKIGVGQSSRSHTANEFVLLSEIKNGIDTYLKLLNGLEL